MLVIASDSSCDLPVELAAKNNILVVPFYISFDGVKYKKELSEISIDTIYKTMRADAVFPKTSLPTISDYVEAFTPHLKNGDDILCFCISGKFSGSYQSAVNAMEILKSEFPERTIVVRDSVSATRTQGEIVLQAAKYRDAGKSVDEICELVKSLNDQMIIFFTVGTLEYLQRGGRVGKAAALAGTLLNIKPLLSLKNGELYPESKVRGRKKTLTEITRMAVEYTNGRPDGFDFGIIHADCQNDAVFITETLKSQYGIAVPGGFGDIGVTIGAHTGPDTIGIWINPKDKTE